MADEPKKQNESKKQLDRNVSNVASRAVLGAVIPGGGFLARAAARIYKRKKERQNKARQTSRR